MNLKDLTLTELHDLNTSVVKLIRSRRNEAAQDAKRQFRVGDAVEFHLPKAGRFVHAVVEKINARNVSCRETNPDGDIRWTVNPTLLRARGEECA